MILAVSFCLWLLASTFISCNPCTKESCSRQRRAENTGAATTKWVSAPVRVLNKRRGSSPGWLIKYRRNPESAIRLRATHQKWGRSQTKDFNRRWVEGEKGEGNWRKTGRRSERILREDSEGVPVQDKPWHHGGQRKWNCCRRKHFRDEVRHWERRFSGRDHCHCKLHVLSFRICFNVFVMTNRSKLCPLYYFWKSNFLLDICRVCPALESNFVSELLNQLKAKLDVKSPSVSCVCWPPRHVMLSPGPESNLWSFCLALSSQSWLRV